MRIGDAYGPFDVAGRCALRIGSVWFPAGSEVDDGGPVGRITLMSKPLYGWFTGGYEGCDWGAEGWRACGGGPPRFGGGPRFCGGWGEYCCWVFGGIGYWGGRGGPPEYDPIGGGRYWGGTGGPEGGFGRRSESNACA